MGYRASDRTYYATTTKMQVTHLALQTDTCDTLYVTKNTLTAYTIVIVQNAQVLQYDQLQTARNQASLETLLRAEELMTAHFNLAVLANEKDIDITQMPRSLKPLLMTQNCQPQLQMTRPTSRYPVVITLKIVNQRGHTLQEPSPQPAEQNTDLLTEYRQVTSLMTLGTMTLILMSIHTHTT